VAEIARACAYLGAHPAEARSWGEAGRAVARRITWDACIEALLS
jgi:glycosyltransferase involved in cell wall biosynthesis